MAKVIRRETRKRGFFGWVFLLLFLAFNAFMAFWLFSYWGDLSSTTAASDAERAGKAIGGTVGSGLILMIWVAGSVITGMLALLTRGQRVIVETVS